MWPRKKRIKPTSKVEAANKVSSAPLSFRNYRSRQAPPTDYCETCGDEVDKRAIRNGECRQCRQKKSYRDRL